MTADLGGTVHAPGVGPMLAGVNRGRSGSRQSQEGEEGGDGEGEGSHPAVVGGTGRSGDFNRPDWTDVRGIGSAAFEQR